MTENNKIKKPIRKYHYFFLAEVNNKFTAFHSIAALEKAFRDIYKADIKNIIQKEHKAIYIFETKIAPKLTIHLLGTTNLKYPNYPFLDAITLISKIENN